jgi:methylphosphotriester-DNA--protein-cysteine methyltransferase
LSVVYTEVAPGAALAHIVRCYWTIEGSVAAGDTVANRVLPDGCMDVLFDLGEAMATGSAGRAEPARVIGAMTRAIVVGMRGRVDVVGIRFQPGAAVAYLGVPAPELTAKSVGLSDVRRGTGDLVERALEAGDVAQVVDPAGGGPAGAAGAVRARLRRRASVLDRALIGSLLREPDGLVSEAVRLIEASRGAIAIGEMEQGLGVSARTLVRRYTTAAGITPKTACRVARLQAATAAIRRDPDGSLARIAVLSGFHDQPHMTRDFTDLARITPAGFAREVRDRSVQDATAPDA